MVRRVLSMGLITVVTFALAGCATVNKKEELSNQDLRNKITALEAQLSEKDNEINSLKDEMTKKEQPAVNASAQAVSEPVRIDAKMIQTALKNAGYYQGIIDGKMGKKTRSAVKEFQ